MGNRGESVQTVAPFSAAKEMLAKNDIGKNERVYFCMGVSPERCVWEPSIRDWRPKLIKCHMINTCNGILEVTLPNGQKKIDAAPFVRNWQRRNVRLFFSGDSLLAENDIFPNGAFLKSHPIAESGRKAYSWPWEEWERHGLNVVWNTIESERIAVVDKMIAKKIISPANKRLKEESVKNARSTMRSFEARMKAKSAVPTDANLEQYYFYKLIYLQMKARLDGKDPFIYPDAKTYNIELGDPAKIDFSKTQKQTGAK